MEQISSELLILCEGDADVAFFKRLLRTRQIPGFDVICGKGQDGRCMGESGFRPFFEAISGGATSGPTVKGIIIVRDSDKDGGASFGKVKAMLKSIPRAPVPEKPMEIKKAGGFPTVAILLIPWHDRPGTLDTLLLDCISNEHAEVVTECASEFARCAGAGGWHVCHLSKLKLRCILGALTKGNPGMSVALSLQRTDCIFDVMHTSIDRIAEFLKTFATAALPVNSGAL
jgi:hypothetical protein